MTILRALQSYQRRAGQNPAYLKLTKSVTSHVTLNGECIDLSPFNRASHDLNNKRLEISENLLREKESIHVVSDVTTNSNSSFLSCELAPDTFHNHAIHQKITFSSRSNPLLSQLEHNKRTNSYKMIRPITSMTDLVPEMAKNWTIWGGSGMIIKAFHCNGLIPYWGCMSLTNITVRTGLLPLVVNGARTSARFGTVAPEVQFLVSIFQNDLRKLKEQKARPSEQFALMRITFQSLRGLYKLHDVNPMHVLKSPLLQIPIFYYFSIDVRKLINGGDPDLAQELTDSGLLWVSDLTDPDPWYGFPIISGLLLYLNVEMAIGQKSLSGESSSKSNLARILKDGFQSLAVFMPCFMSHSPAGVQIYLMTSFVFTLFQGMALRHDPIRDIIGLPAMGAPMPESKFAKEFIELKELEKKAAEARGNGPVLGTGVLAPGFQTSFAGVNRPSSIICSTYKETSLKEIQVESFAPVENSVEKHFIPWCIRAPPNFDLESLQENGSEEIVDHVISQTADDVMEAANQGQRPKPPIQVLKLENNNEVIQLSTKSLKSKKKKAAKHSRSRKNRRRS